jgi:hypothetical protein
MLYPHSLLSLSDPLSQCHRLITQATRKQLIGLGHRLFAMRPFGFNRIEPGALGWQEAREDADTFAALLDLLVMCVKPGAGQPTTTPARVIPDQHQGLFPCLSQLLATPV